MTDDLVGRPLWDAFCDLCNTHGPRGYGRDSKERIAFGSDLNAFWQLVEADHQIAAARIEALEGALILIVARDRQREWTATDDNPESHWVERDGQYAKIARAALAKDKSDG